jgi:hypothetical protein
MFDLTEEEKKLEQEYQERQAKIKKAKKKTKPTNLYTKTFTNSEWEKLDVVIPGLEYGVTIQTILKQKYTIKIVEDNKGKTENISCPKPDPLLQDKLKIAERKYREIKKVFLSYAQDHYPVDSDQKPLMKMVNQFDD